MGHQEDHYGQHCNIHNDGDHWYDKNQDQQHDIIIKWRPLV